MRTAIIAAMLMLAFRLPAEDRPKDDKGNPFGVKIDGKAGADEKPLNPALTDDEHAWFKKYIRAMREDPNQHVDGKDAVYDAIRSRLQSGSKTWTDGDAQARAKTIEELESMDAAVHPRVISSDVIDDDTRSVFSDYIASHSDNPDDLARRMNIFGKCVYVGWRKMLSKFLDNDKYKKATPVERYQFVVNWLMPKATLGASAKYQLKSLIEDLKEDAGIVDKPGNKPDNKAKH